MNAQDKGKALLSSKSSLPGVIMSRADLGALSTVPPSLTTVTKLMWKDGRNTYLGVKEYALNSGEVIKVGRLGRLYRIIKFVKKEGTGENIILVKRVNGYHITHIDINNIFIGDKVRILNRKSFIEALDDPLYKEYPEPCRRVLPNRIIPCEETDCEN